LRKGVRAALCVLVAIAFVVPAGVLAGPQSVRQSGEKEWTILIFWACDNNLEFTTEFCMQLWEKSLTSNDNVNIVVFIDKLSVDGTWIYEIGPGTRTVVATWPEMNSSDPATLEKFVVWGENNYQAKKNMVLISDHGYGWRGICQDESDGDTLMPNHGIAEALKNSAAKTGKGVDILAFDACNMATIEVAYEMRGAARYLVASETTEPYDGLPYEMFITDMVKNPSISAEQLAKNIVYEYVLYYREKWEYPHQMRYSQDFSTMAAIDTTKMDAVGVAFDKVTDALLPLIPDHMKQVERARGYALIGTWTNMAGYAWMPDVKMFIDGLRVMTDHPGLIAAIDGFDAAFDTAVIAAANSEKYHDTVHGMNFWFPASMSQYNMRGYSWAQQFVYTDVGLDLISQSSWVDCLMAYYAA